MSDQDRFAQLLIEVLKSCRDLIFLPTDKRMETTFKWSLCLTALNAIFAILGVYTFLSWEGCLLCSLMLFLLLFIERRENDALSRMYHTVELSVKEAKRRAESASTSIGVRRSGKRDNPAKQKAGGKTSTRGRNNNTRGSVQRSNKH